MQRKRERKMLIEILDGAAAGAEADVNEACRVLTNSTTTTSTSRFSFSSFGRLARTYSNAFRRRRRRRVDGFPKLEIRATGHVILVLVH